MGDQRGLKEVGWCVGNTGLLDRLAMRAFECEGGIIIDVD
jgi:hypothetical protein